MPLQTVEAAKYFCGHFVATNQMSIRAINQNSRVHSDNPVCSGVISVRKLPPIGDTPR
jgi:hypothetical protein